MANVSENALWRCITRLRRKPDQNASFKAVPHGNSTLNTDPELKTTDESSQFLNVREDCLLTDKSYHRDMSASSTPINHNRTCDGLLVCAFLKGGCNLFFKNLRH